MKTCSTCKESKLHTAFVKSPLHKDGYHGVCKPCRNDQRRKNGRADTKEQRRKWALKSSFNLTIEQYNSMLRQQGGVCKICKAGPETSYKGVLHVDHNHKTGKVRGLLCAACNVAIGYMVDSPARLRDAATYLEKA